MRWLALGWDWFTFLVVALAVTVSSVAVHKPDLLQAAVVQAYPQDLPALSEDEFLTMDNRVWP